MAKILGSSKVTVRYQITVPEDVRKVMKIESGQTLAFVEEDGKIVLKTDV
ncbi:AbrB/MazE/SpoVT family DNA-binding domain-containing protein [Nitrosopumilus maritimus]